MYNEIFNHIKLTVLGMFVIWLLVLTSGSHHEANVQYIFII